MGKPTHYPLGHEEYLRIRQLLKPRELDVYLYLATKHPFDDSVMEIDTAEIAENLGYHRRTVQTIVKRLSELELLDVEYTRFKYRTARHGSKSKRVASESNDSFKANQMTRTSESNDSFKANQMTRTSESNDSFTTAETQTEQSSGKPSDYSNFIHTLSEHERERFLEFSRKSASRLNSPTIVLIEKWIVDNHHWLYQEFEKVYRQEPKHSGPGQSSAAATVQKSKKDDMGWTLDQLKREYPHSWRDAAAHFGLEMVEEPPPIPARAESETSDRELEEVR